MSLVLTGPQEQSLDLSSHLCVTANAGAGKTSVLARRFVEIVLRTDAKLSEIVAITFTEQAAGELRKKVHDVLLERERDGRPGPSERRRLADARNQLSSAIIGTIHSFCGRVLRMYPAEADVDASFTVVEGQDRARLIAESIAETFSDLMGRTDGAGPPDDFRALLRAVPPARLERFLLRLFTQREQMYRYFRRHEAEGAADTPARLLLERIAATVVDRAAESGWVDRAREVSESAAGKGAAALREMLGDPGTVPERGRLEELLLAGGELVFTSKTEYRSSFLGQRAPEELPAAAAAWLRAFEGRYGKVLRSAREEGAEGRETAYRGLLGTLERTFLAASKKYDARKDELGVLDFEDLQIRTVELLGRDDVRQRLRTEYRFLLVDEFQDTNDLQYALLRGLAGDGTGGNLFIVGDPKQSIYGFRNADVGIFYDARAEIAAKASPARSAPPENGRAASGVVVLAESFRPLPEIAAFVNQVFSRLMRRGSSRHDVEYDEIIVARTDRGPGSVELLLVPPGAGAERGAAVREECAMIARRLREVAAGGRGYGDCAVLLRDRTNLPALEKAFEEEGVPYLLAGGVGYFQTQEVYDFLNYLRFLVSPGDDTALAGLLRSPFFGLTDADLFEISTAHDATFWEKLSAAAGAPAAPAGASRAREILAAHRSLADRISVPRLLRRIATDTGWMGVMAGLSHGPQRRENFLKLLEIARRRGATGPFTLYDFMSHLDHRAEEEEREGQASTAATGSAVRVMTVHAAKGLEFPVVFLPFLDRAQRQEGEPIVDTEFGIGFRLSGEEDQPPLYACLRALSAEKRLAEEKRIFYVACTRARDALVLSGNEGMKAGTDAPLGWLMEAARAAGARDGGSTLDFGRVAVKALEASGGAPEHREIAVPLAVAVRRGVAPAPGQAAGATAARGGPGEARVLTAPVTDTGGGETYSATMLKTYVECPARYYLEYVLGLGSQGHAVADRDANGEDDAGPRARAATTEGLAALEGELTHLALSTLTAGDDDPAVEAAVDAAVSGHPDARGIPGLRDRVGGTVAEFARSAAGREILSRPGARTEFQVSASLGDAVVMGKIDRLFEGADKLIEFVDYKTDAVAPGGAAGRAAVHRHQMELYAFLLSRLFAQDTVRGTLVFLKAGPAQVTFDFGGETFARLERSLAATISAIRAGSFPHAVKPCTGCPGGRGACPVVAPTP